MTVNRSEILTTLDDISRELQKENVNPQRLRETQKLIVDTLLILLRGENADSATQHGSSVNVLEQRKKQSKLSDPRADGDARKNQAQRAG